jgi:hypothetical protein
MNRVLKGVLLASVAAVISACSGGTGSGGSSMTGSATLPAAADAFTQSVQAVAANSSETDLPLATDGYVPVAADNADPVAVH